MRAYKSTDVDVLASFPQLANATIESDLFLFYLLNIDKIEYNTFICWVDDMVKSDLLVIC